MSSLLSDILLLSSHGTLDLTNYFTMSYHTISLALIAVVFFLVRYLDRTDVPKIKNLPEIPGVPIFGNLLQFGSSHAKVAASFAEKYGPVFQVRLGNRVGLHYSNGGPILTLSKADRLCQHI